MLKKIIFIVIFISCACYSQKPQAIAYYDMEYVLENVPDYNAAQLKLDKKVEEWKKKIERQEKKLNDLKITFENEKVLLTEELAIERKEDIRIKEVQLAELEDSYFGSNGAYFDMRQKLVQPIQDDIFNAVKQIATKKKYDFIFDRTSEMSMIYASPKYDISKLLISYLTKTEKERKREEAALKKQQQKEALQKRIEEQKKKRAEKQQNVIHR